MFVEPGSIVETPETVDRLLSDTRQRTNLGRQTSEDGKQYVGERGPKER